MDSGIMLDPEKLILSQLQLPGDVKKLSIPQCEALCGEIREKMVQTVSENGGHLASNLGTVEMTLAMHRVFQSPKDKFVWDVGHQCYTHKLLTGRVEEFSTLRKEDGLSGFPKPQESAHDSFISGHSSTAISVAHGIATGMRLQGDCDHYVIAVVGDGAMTGGLSYEGMNNAGKSKNNLIVILNDNEMSISRNVGGLAKYLSGFRSSENYVRTKKAVEQRLNQNDKFGTHVIKAIRSTKGVVREVLLKDATMFEDFGFVYLGPVDGHDIEAVEEVLSAAKEYHRPVFVHLQTIKGKGYTPAEIKPDMFHGLSGFDIDTGNPEISGVDSYSDVFGKELLHLASVDSKICAITAAMEAGTGLKYFAKTYPSRYFDVGIAEQHAVTFGAALASTGMIPVFAVYSSFLQRAYDQLMHDVAISGQHMVLAVDRAGVVGEDGETHHGMFDVSFLSSIPGTSIYAPACNDELRLCLRRAIYRDKGLACVRYPRGKDEGTYPTDKLNTNYTLFSMEHAKILLVSYGREIHSVLQAAKNLRQAGIKVDVLKLTRIFPISDQVMEIMMRYDSVIFFEESYYYGGISSLVGSMLAEKNFHGSYKRIAQKDFLKQATISSQMKKMGLDVESIEETVRKDLEL